MTLLKVAGTGILGRLGPSGSLRGIRLGGGSESRSHWQHDSRLLDAPCQRRDGCQARSGIRRLPLPVPVPLALCTVPVAGVWPGKAPAAMGISFKFDGTWILNLRLGSFYGPIRSVHGLAELLLRRQSQDYGR